LSVPDEGNGFGEGRAGGNGLGGRAGEGGGGLDPGADAVSDGIEPEEVLGIFDRVFAPSISSAKTTEINAATQTITKAVMNPGRNLEELEEPEEFEELPSRRWIDLL